MHEYLQPFLILTKEDNASTSIDTVNNFNPDEDKIILKVNYKTPINFAIIQASIQQNGVNTEIDLDNLADAQRKESLSKNNSENINLDDLAQQERNNSLSKNVASQIDIDALAQRIRTDLLSRNVSTSIDLDSISQAIRTALLSQNVGTAIDLDALAQSIRNALLSNNVGNPIDLDALAQSIRTALLSNNVSNPIDLDALAQSIRNDLLANNVSNPIDLDALAQSIRTDLLSRNVSNPIDLDNISSQLRNSLLANNVATQIDIDATASKIRKDLLARNIADTDPLGANLILVGTSVFVGISNLDVLSAIIREVLLLKNKIFARENLSQSLWGLGNDVYGSLVYNANLSQVERNLFNLNGETYRGNVNSELLRSKNPDVYLMLDAKYNYKVQNIETNSTPAAVIQENNGQYFAQVSADKVLKPQDGEIGTAESMMSQTVPTQTIEVAFNNSGKRGVHNIIDKIRKSNTTISKNFNIQGEESENNQTFVIGIKPDGTNVLAKKRYTYKNPHALPRAEGLIFSITNYAMEQDSTIYLPAYIKAFQHSESADWNNTQFLGRPEPLYTYSTGSREGSIEFFILTDYAQTVEIGYNYDAPSSDGSAENKVTFEKSFSNSFKTQFLELEKNRSERINLEKDRAALIIKRDSAISADTSSSNWQEQIDALTLTINKLDEKSEKLVQSNPELFTPYSETRETYNNVYNGLTKKDSDYNTGYGDVSYTLSSTVDRLNEMKQNLMFQPAFFSGDKLDFRERMKFIQKMTKPANNKNGAAFTKAPVCHIRLGDWFNHDVIVTSVNYNYDNSPWTLDGRGQVQPMCVSVTISFKIISEWHKLDKPREQVRMVPLADDYGRTGAAFFGGNSTSNI